MWCMSKICCMSGPHGPSRPHVPYFQDMDLNLRVLQPLLRLIGARYGWVLARYMWSMSKICYMSGAHGPSRPHVPYFDDMDLSLTVLEP